MAPAKAAFDVLHGRRVNYKNNKKNIRVLDPRGVRRYRRGGQVLRRVRVLLGGGPVAGHQLAAGERVPGTAGEDRAAVLPVHAEQPERVPVPGPPGPGHRGRVKPDPVHAHVLRHARVPGGRRPAVAQRHRPADIAPIRRQHGGRRLGTRLRVAVHAGRGQHPHGGPGHGAPHKRHAGQSISQSKLKGTGSSMPYPPIDKHPMKYKLDVDIQFINF